MKTNLLEAYANRLNLAESVYANNHNGQKLSDTRKLATAVCLNNVNKFLKEAFTNSVGTQLGDLGAYKKFCMTLTNLAVPDLIVYDIMAVEPMVSFSGFIAYLNIEIGSNKGQSKQGDLVNNSWQYGTTNPNYTSSNVVESFVGDNSTTAFTLAWTPVLEVAKVLVAGVEQVAGTDYTVANGVVTFTSAPAASADIRIAYVYDNTFIPANDLPIITAKMEPISLTAKARRIAIYYSQMANYQAKQDYGFDLGETLATQAVGELQREIDVEAVNMLVEAAGSDDSLVWSKTQPFGVNLKDHYESFANQIEVAKSKLYKRTKKFAPNFMIIAADILPVLSLVSGFNAASTSEINGPYFCGSIAGLKVFVSPDVAEGNYVLGVANPVQKGTAAVFAPYMAVTPTQLLGFADGAMSQGWSTLYDMKILNPILLIAGRVTA
jgi:hypothetical protein